MSLMELLASIERLHGSRPELIRDAWRTGDQRYYVSDTRRLMDSTGWAPRVGVDEGLARLYAWLREDRVGGEAVTVGRSVR
jgi:CDP-paratose 2-epimerase